MRKRTCLSASRGCSSPYYQLRRCTVGSCSSFRLDEQQQNPQQHELEQDDTGKLFRCIPLSLSYLAGKQIRVFSDLPRKPSSIIQGYREHGRWGGGGGGGGERAEEGKIPRQRNG